MKALLAEMKQLCGVHRVGSSNNFYDILDLVPRRMKTKMTAPMFLVKTSCQALTACATHASDTSQRPPSLLANSYVGTRPRTRLTSLCDYAAPVINPLRRGKIDEELAKMIATDFQPFKIVEDKGFKSYSSALSPSYNLPSRKTVSQTVSNIYHREAASLKERVISLFYYRMLDIKGHNFIHITCHFIKDFKICSCLLD